MADRHSPGERTQPPVTVCLGGDVMTGRGVDQILAHPGDAELREAYLGDARSYVELAERVNGPIPRPVDWSWVWGDALAVLDRMRPDVCVLNLETSVTASGDFAPGKGIHYRMHPDNVAVLAPARPDCLALANNHVLDFGRAGLVETLDTLHRAGLATAGAGHDATEAGQPAVVDLAERGRIVVVAIGGQSSGIPASWAAGDDRPGVAFVPDLHNRPAHQARQLLPAKRPGDIVVVSVHWGSNWGYDVARSHVRLARRLIDAGADVVHGHSSHHPRAVAVYRNRLVLYGCGDLINDYEGINGYEEFRPDLRPLYGVSLDPRTGELLGLRIHPLRVRRMRLHHAPSDDVAWLRDALDRVCRPHGTRLAAADDALTLEWDHSPGRVTPR